MCIKKEKQTRKRKHVLKIINGNTIKKKEEIKVRNVISKNITLPKSNVLPYFSKGSMLDVLDGLEYFYNLLKEYEYKENKALMKYSLKILWKKQASKRKCNRF